VALRLLPHVGPESPMEASLLGFLIGFWFGLYLLCHVHHVTECMVVISVSSGHPFVLSGLLVIGFLLHLTVGNDFRHVNCLWSVERCLCHLFDVWPLPLIMVPQVSVTCFSGSSRHFSISSGSGMLVAASLSLTRVCLEKISARNNSAVVIALVDVAIIKELVNIFPVLQQMSAHHRSTERNLLSR